MLLRSFCNPFSQHLEDEKLLHKKHSCLCFPEQTSRRKKGEETFCILWVVSFCPCALFLSFYFWLDSSTTLLNSKVLHSWRETFFHYIERFAISLFVLLLLFTFSCWRRVFYWLNGFDGPFLVSFYIFLWLLYFGLIVNTFLIFFVWRAQRKES